MKFEKPIGEMQLADLAALFSYPPGHRDPDGVEMGRKISEFAASQGLVFGAEPGYEDDFQGFAHHYFRWGNNFQAGIRSEQLALWSQESPMPERYLIIRSHIHPQHDLNPKYLRAILLPFEKLQTKTMETFPTTVKSDFPTRDFYCTQLMIPVKTLPEMVENLKIMRGWAEYQAMIDLRFPE